MATIKSPTLYVKCSQSAFDELFEKFNKASKSNIRSLITMLGVRFVRQLRNVVPELIIKSFQHLFILTLIQKKYSLKMFQTFILMINPSVSFLSMS